MTQKRLIIIDGNSLGHIANNSGTLKIGESEVQAIYNFLRDIRKIYSIYGAFYDIVVAWDGASWRKMIAHEYKANREKADTKAQLKLLKLKDSYTKQRPVIQTALRKLGVPQISAINMEADDLAAMIVQRSPNTKIKLYTADKDWLQLVSENVSWCDLMSDDVIDLSNFEAKTGVETTSQFVEVKALCGDAGDNIAGVGGIGEKGAIAFIKEYGSFSSFSNQVITGAVDPTSLHKKFRALAEDESKLIAFNRNLTLVDLYTKDRPAPINMRLEKESMNRSFIRSMFELLLFNSILSDFDGWISVFPDKEVK